ncbi:MAG: hypothetical protein JW969_15095 [Spirochaetales bacterium]|nr:hypothetical protein [Spirochaetales bacterium]
MMDKIPEHLLEKKEFFDIGYSGLVDYGSWRVAILNYINELDPENLTFLSRHNETDEVFVLLKGQCILFIGEESEGCLKDIHAVPMTPQKIYNIRKGTWHTHALSKDASVLIIENKDTTKLNSPELFITPEQHRSLVKKARKLLQ